MATKALIDRAEGRFKMGVNQDNLGKWQARMDDDNVVVAWTDREGEPLALDSIKNVHPHDAANAEAKEWTKIWGHKPEQNPWKVDVDDACTVTPDLESDGDSDTESEDEDSYDDLASLQEVTGKKLLRKLRQSAKGCAGPDDWAWADLLRLPISFWNRAAQLWTALVERKGKILATWKQMRVALIRKPHDATGALRPISVGSILRR